MSTRAVFFDVDFTLIHPGPALQGHGHREICARHGIDIDEALFDASVAAASSMLDAGSGVYDPVIFIEYTRRIIEGMGGGGPTVLDAAREVYDECAACHHFSMYEEVPDVLRALHGDGYLIGLISNTHRSLETFERHFELHGLFAVAISSSDHGFMKPHPSIFEEGLRRMNVAANEAVMVGDNLAHDIAGARAVGMRGILVARAGPSKAAPPDVPVIQSLRELKGLL